MSEPDYGQLGERLHSYEARLAHVVDRLIPFRDARSYGMDRALVAGGRFFGLGKRRMRARVQSYARARRFARPSEFTAMIEAGRKASALEAVPSVVDQCGYVYRARLSHYPHIFKIGFSVNPERRLKELFREAGTAVEMESVELGTLFDEAYLLLVLGRVQIAGEWFFDPSLPVSSMPEFLKFGIPIAEWQRAAEQSLARGSNRPIGALGHAFFNAISEGA